MDIIDLPHNLTNNNNEKLYLLSITVHFSKYVDNFILKNKNKSTLMNKIKLFIDKHGTPEKILTDNGGNSLISISLNIAKFGIDILN